MKKAVLIICAIVGVFLIGMFADRCNPEPKVFVTELVGQEHREEIVRIDSILIPRDSVENGTRIVNNIVIEYRTTTDTLYKLQLCDSLATACDSLANQYNRQDSLFRLQIESYSNLVNDLDSANALLAGMVEEQGEKVDKLRRRNRRLIGVTVATICVEVVHVLVKH